MSWPTVSLSEVAEIVSGSTPKTGTSEYWGGNIPWVTPADLTKLHGHVIDDTPRKLTEAGLASSGARMLPVGSVLFSSRAPIGHVAITGVPMSTNQGFKSLVPAQEELDSKFLYWWLKANKEYLQGLGVGATFKEVSKAIVANVHIPLPPLLEQRRIAVILDQADELRAKRRQALALLDELADGLFIDMFGPIQKHDSIGLLELCGARSGGTPSKQRADYWNGEIPWFSPKDMKDPDLWNSIDHCDGSGCSRIDASFASREHGDCSCQRNDSRPHLSCRVHSGTGHHQSRHESVDATRRYRSAVPRVCHPVSVAGCAQLSLERGAWD